MSLHYRIGMLTLVPQLSLLLHPLVVLVTADHQVTVGPCRSDLPFAAAAASTAAAIVATSRVILPLALTPPAALVDFTVVCLVAVTRHRPQCGHA